MCGIVGYLGNPEKTIGVLLNGLKSLEYRGYDSSGICIVSDEERNIFKSEGKLENLRLKIEGKNLTAPTGIGHTRWATHGKPTENNAHPHSSGPVSIVHNGIIENYKELKDALQRRDISFIQIQILKYLHILSMNIIMTEFFLKKQQLKGLPMLRGHMQLQYYRKMNLTRLWHLENSHHLLLQKMKKRNL